MIHLKIFTYYYYYSLVFVSIGGEAEDVAKKKGLVDLSPSAPEKGIVFAVCIFAEVKMVLNI